MIKESMKKKLVLAMAAGVCVSSLSACKDSGNKESSSSEVTTAQSTSATEKEEPVRDLGGIEIVIGDWWSTEEVSEPTNAKDEATQEYREMIQKKYNFKIKQSGIADYGTYQENFTVSTMAGDPKADIFIMNPAWLAKPISNKLVYDLATLESLDFSEAKWNTSVKEIMTKGDSIYGMTAGKPEPGMGVFWNKRLFKEAGLEPDLPYDLQKSGEWTWAKFEELCKTLTIDKDNDGKMDTYAMASFSDDLYKGALISNNAQYIGQDADGKYTNGTTTPEFLEATQWATGLIQKGYEMPTAEGANWDWFISAFHDSKVAMQAAGQYKVGTWKDMTDDFGFVLFPKGPKSTNYATTTGDNMAIIPSCFDKEKAEKIAYAYNLWTEETPGYEGEDDWKSSYYSSYRDERAVDETISMMYDEGVGHTDYAPMVTGLDLGTFLWDTYALVKTPAEKIEENATAWQVLIDEANKQ